jgi:hypothetical protein
MNEEQRYEGGAAVARHSAERHATDRAGTNTGQDAQRRIRPSHQRILDVFRAQGAMTPDELAAQMGRSVFYSRPRCTELRAMGLLHPTGGTRENATSGLRAAVLSL